MSLKRTNQTSVTTRVANLAFRVNRSDREGGSYRLFLILTEKCENNSFPIQHRTRDFDCKLDSFFERRDWQPLSAPCR